MGKGNIRKVMRQTREAMEALREERRFNALSPEEQAAEIEAEEQKKRDLEKQRQERLAKEFGLKEYDATIVEEKLREQRLQHSNARKEKCAERMSLSDTGFKDPLSMTVEGFFEVKYEDNVFSAIHTFTDVRGYSFDEAYALSKEIKRLRALVNKGPYSKYRISKQEAIQNTYTFINNMFNK